MNEEDAEEEENKPHYFHLLTESNLLIGAGGRRGRCILSKINWIL